MPISSLYLKNIKMKIFNNGLIFFKYTLKIARILFNKMNCLLLNDFGGRKEFPILILFHKQIMAIFYYFGKFVFFIYFL